MTETSPATVAPAATPKKGKGSPKKKGAGSKKTAVVHPPTSQMVNAAIESLNEKGGSSLQAIKKYISSNYTIDGAKASIFIRKYLKSAVDAGTLVRTKGTGASGSFKLPGEKDKKGAAKPKVKKPAAKKAGTATPKKTAPKKKTAAKKSPAAKKPNAAAPSKAKAKPAKKAKSPAKPKKPVAKKIAKSPKKKTAAKKKYINYLLPLHNISPALFRANK